MGGGNNINDDTIYSITNTLVNNNKIRKIILDESHAVTAAAWQSFSAVLQSPNSVLETLGLKFNSPFNDETLVILVSSLANNTAVKELILVVEDEERYDGEDICEIFSDHCWETVVKILCNTTSIMSTYNSNHTLERLSDPCDYCSSYEDGYWMPEEVRSLLVINQDSNRQAARLKIIQTHFSGSEINVQPFVDMLFLMLWLGWFEMMKEGLSIFMMKSSGCSSIEMASIYYISSSEVCRGYSKVLISLKVERGRPFRRSDFMLILVVDRIIVSSQLGVNYRTFGVSEL